MATTFLTNEDKNLIEEELIRISQEISSIKNDLGITVPTLKWYPGNISAQGAITDGATNVNNYYSDILKKSDFDSVLLQLEPGAIRTVSYCTYDENDNFIERKAWLSSSTTTTEVRTYNIDNSYSVRFLISTYSGQAEAGKTAEEVLENITLDIKYKGVTDSNNSIETKNSFDWLSRVDRNVHFSIDDVSQPLYDLTTNNPASIYDHAFFGYLKQLHDTYGICITCNTFNTNSTIAGYDISNVPNTWAAEFTAAKDWLKFAFHAKNDTAYAENLTTASEDYKKFADAVIYFTGTEACIDRVARLGFFSGNLTEIYKMKNAERGIIGLLCADQEDRDSYYLDDYANSKVQNTGLYYDKITKLYFIKSMYRLDSGDVDYIKTQLMGDSRKSKIVELFCHSTAVAPNIGENTRTRISNVLNLLVTERGYGSSFVMDLINSWQEEMLTESLA